MCTRLVPELYQTCTRLVPDLHQTCTRLAPDLHQTCTRLAPDLYQTCTRLAPDLHQTCTRLALYIPSVQPMATLFLFLFFSIPFSLFFPFSDPNPLPSLLVGTVGGTVNGYWSDSPWWECRTNPCEDGSAPPQQPHFHARTEKHNKDNSKIQQLLQHKRIEICNMIDGLLHCVAFEIFGGTHVDVCAFLCLHTQTKDCRWWRHGRQSFDLELVADIHFIYILGLCAAERKCKNAVYVVILHKRLFSNCIFLRSVLCFLLSVFYRLFFFVCFFTFNKLKKCVFLFFWPVMCIPVTYSFHVLPG